MLDEDNDFWTGYRAVRRGEIDAEEARVAKDRERLKGTAECLQELTDSAHSVASSRVAPDPEAASALPTEVEDEENQDTAVATS